MKKKQLKREIQELRVAQNITTSQLVNTRNRLRDLEKQLTGLRGAVGEMRGTWVRTSGHPDCSSEG